MLPETVDYTSLHTCGECQTKHRLMPYPVDAGWIVATVCGCRAKGGLPRMYSTETEPLATFDLAEVAISWLLHPTHVSELEAA